MREGVPTVQAALAEWHDDLTLGGQASTARTYRYALRHHLSEWPDDRICRQIVAQAIQRTSRNTARTVWSALASFCRWAGERGYLAANPMDHVPLPRAEHHHHRYPRKDELQRVYAACKSDRDRAIVRLLLHGLRAGQLLGLRWSDLRGDELLVRTHKTSPPHLIALDPETVRLLELMPRTSERIVSICYKTLRAIIIRLGRDARVPGLHAHAFRHAFASHWMLENGDSLALQQLGGWTSGTMISRVYAKSAMQEAALKRARELNLTERLLG